LEKQIKGRFEIFCRDPFDPCLKTHKLRGKLENYWSFSVSETHRVMFEFLGKREVGLIDIGDHSIYQ